MALTQVTSIGLKDGEIVNADLHSAASVALSKLASTGALGSAVTATTQSASDDSTKLATTAFVQAAVTSLIDGAPGSLNTLNELAAAINDDSSYATTLTTALATKLPLAGGTLTGTLTSNSNINTTGSISGSNLTLTHGDPKINFVDSGDNPDYQVVVNAGHFMIKDATASADRLYINASSTTITNNLNVNAGLDVTGTTTSNYLTLSAVNPNITFTDTNDNPDFRITVNSGEFYIEDLTNSATRLLIKNTGDVTLGYAGNSLYFQNGFNNSASRIQNGGASNSSNLRFYTRNSGTESEKLQITSSGSVNIGGDYTQTTTKVQITGTTGLNGIQLSQNGSTTQNLKLKGLNTQSSNDVGISLYNNSNNWCCQLYGTNGGTAYYGFLDGNWNQWDIKKQANGAFEVDEGSGLHRVLTAGNIGSGGTLSNATPYVNQLWCANWVNFSSNDGLYWGGGSASGWHMWPYQSHMMRFRSAHSTTSHLALADSGNNIRGGVYADSNGVGFTDTGENWAFRTDRNSNEAYLYDQHFKIDTDGTYDIGTGSLKWRRIYTNNVSINTSNTNTNFCINGAGSANVMTIRNTTGGNGNVGILFSTQDHSGGREKAAIYHQETHGSAHYGGDFIFCLNTATGSAGQVGPSDVKLRVNRGGAALAINTCKAYGSFNQTNHGANRNYNIQSYTDYGTGQTRVTFTTALAADYIVTTGGSRDLPENSRCYPSNIDNVNTGYFEITNHNDGSTNVDWSLMMFTCHGSGGG